MTQAQIILQYYGMVILVLAALVVSMVGGIIAAKISDYRWEKNLNK
jgi:hypothetical protein